MTELRGAGRAAARLESIHSASAEALAGAASLSE